LDARVARLTGIAVDEHTVPEFQLRRV
jgi:hypothetical protein